MKHTIQTAIVALAIAITSLCTGCQAHQYSLITVRNEVGVIGIGGTGEFKTFHVRIDLTTGAECTLDGNGYLANVNGKIADSCK
jgi:hypothetical protein